MFTDLTNWTLSKALHFKSFTLIILAALFLFSCGGKDGDPDTDGHYVKFKADGKAYVIKDSDASAIISCSLMSGNAVSYAGKVWYEFQLSGVANQGGPYPILNMTIESKEKIATKEYKLDELQYSTISKKMFGQLPIADVQKKYENYGASSGAVITIKEITATDIKGTFSGTIIGLSSQLKITDGEFFAKRTD